MFKLLNDIKVVLTECGELEDFARLCFGCFFRFDVDVVFSSQLVHSLLTNKNRMEGDGQYEIWFGIGQ